MKQGVLIAVAAAASAVMVRAQTQPSPTASAGPTFDVAAIKQNKSGENNGRFGGPPTRWTATNAPAFQFILYAFDVRDFQVEGGPDWLKSDRYDINAKSNADSPPVNLGGPDPRRLMLKALLVDRFKLATHTETRERPIYALVAARPDKSLGPKLTPSTTDCVAVGEAFRRAPATATPPHTPDGSNDCGWSTPPGRLAFGTQPMSQVALMLSSLVSRLVVDRTGIAGNYSGTVTYTPDVAPRDGGPDVPAADPNGASLFTAIQEQFGVKLEPARGPVDVLVIDRIERPTED
jgi:uncharacterized protein (TIGR03435 family)